MNDRLRWLRWLSGLRVVGSVKESAALLALKSLEAFSLSICLFGPSQRLDFYLCPHLGVSTHHETL
jgi:hypothetical protein